jgi:hypothetical protein
VKLLLENWRRYLAESEEEELKKKLAILIQKYDLDQKKIKKIQTLAESDDLIEEGLGQDLKNLYRQYGKRVVMGGLLAITSMGAVGGAPAHASGMSFDDLLAAETTGEVYGDVSKSKIAGVELANTVFNAIKDKLPAGAAIDIGVQSTPVAEFNQDALGDTYTTELKNLLEGAGFTVVNTSTNAIEDNLERGTINLFIDALNLRNAVDGDLSDGYRIDIRGSKGTGVDHTEGTYKPAT